MTQLLLLLLISCGLCLIIHRVPEQSRNGPICATDESFRFGGKPSAETANGCCGWPQGCDNMNPDCRYLKHPYKRWARGEITLAELNNINPPKAER